MSSGLPDGFGSIYHPIKKRKITGFFNLGKINGLRLGEDKTTIFVDLCKLDLTKDRIKFDVLRQGFFE